MSEPLKDCDVPRVVKCDLFHPCEKHRLPWRNYDDNGMDIGRRFGVEPPSPAPDVGSDGKRR